MAKTEAKTDERITKRRVTMTNYTTVVGESGKPSISEMSATDYVDSAREGLLEAYVTEAQTRWQHVEVSDEPDAGPGGYHGQTAVPSDLDHELAGQTFAATKD